MLENKNKMHGKSFSKYIGYMKQPILHPEENYSTSYILMDVNKVEMDLMLLTPGTFYHAYQTIRRFNPYCIRIFIPSLRPEFISDIFNLYMVFKNQKLIKWVFPDSFDHYDFSIGQIKAKDYQNQEDSNLTIQYIENPNVDGVYDIITQSLEGSNYFSFFLSDEKLMELMDNDKISFIHVSKSSTLYGGLTYDKILTLHKKHPSVFKRKLVPNDFTSVEELEIYLRNRNYYRRK